jgi:hypothetical protein
MKCAGKIAICLAGGLVLSTSLRADDVVLPGNPYAPVVVRNIFGLNPPPPPVDPNAAAPPVKITPNGIMTILGQLQVLFKVAASKPGDKENSYILTEGERQDDIEVTKIDEKGGIVTFNNHGIVQALPLVPATPSSTPAPAPSFGSANPSPVMPGIAPGGNNGFNNRFGNRGGNFPGRNRGGGNGGDNSGGMNNGYDSSNLRSVPTRGDQTSQSGSQMTAEEQMIMIAAQHAKLQQEGNSAAAIFPPTPIDADAGVVSPPAP